MLFGDLDLGQASSSFEELGRRKRPRPMGSGAFSSAPGEASGPVPQRGAHSRGCLERRFTVEAGGRRREYPSPNPNHQAKRWSWAHDSSDGQRGSQPLRRRTRLERGLPASRRWASVALSLSQLPLGTLASCGRVASFGARHRPEGCADPHADGSARSAAEGNPPSPLTPAPRTRVAVLLADLCRAALPPAGTVPYAPETADSFVPGSESSP